ncbi:MAG TPA: electron transport complex subunit RsxE [Gammaproteobacteria bacterium]|jgi:electron transport complex protein RnfE|nr:electron transport complex subunit RsxE [Gammaproteobacteria bacterium]
MSYSEIFKNGLWNSNAGLVQLLGLCPLLAVTATTVNGFGLGIASLLTLVISNSIVSLIRNFIRPEVRIPVFVLVIASTVTAIDLLLNAFFHELHGILGIFIPLIVTNCVIIARAEAFASKNTLPKAAADGFAMGLGFLALLVVLGSIRELIGQGTLFSQAQLIFGSSAANWQINLSEDYPGFLLAILPPGAFFALGLMIVLKNLIDENLKKRAATTPAPENSPALDSV